MKKEKTYTLVRSDIFLTGKAEEIIKKLKSLSWDEVESNKEFMQRVERRVWQLKGVLVRTTSSEVFLEDLHEADEIKLFEESIKKQRR